MNKNTAKQIERDCVRRMFPCFALHFFREMLELTLPVITSWMIGGMADALLNLDMQRIKGRLAVFIVAFLADVLAQPAVRMWENFLLTRLGFGYGNFMFSKYLRLPMKNAKSMETAVVVQRIDTDTTEYYFLLMQRWTRPLTMAVYLAVLVTMLITDSFNPLFVAAILTLAAIPLIRAAFNGKAKARLKDARLDYEEKREQLEYGMFSARDFLNGFQIGGRYISRAHGEYARYSEKTGNAQDKMNAMDAMFEYLCTYGVPLGVIAVGALLIAGGNMGVGTLLAGYLIMPTITKFYRYFEALILNRHEEIVVRGRLEIFYSGNEPEDSACGPEGTPDLPKELRLQNVSFAYAEDLPKVFDGKSIAVPLSDRVRIAGSNGAGKSTFLSLISGVYSPDDGSVTDENGSTLNCAALRRAVALQEQDGGIFSATVAENLFVSDERLGEAENMLKEMGFEKPLDYQVSESGGNLSPGEKKKIMLVRAFLDPSPVLALDEPLNHLDAEGMQVLVSRLKKEKRPVILVSHSESIGSDFRLVNI
ncbi:MAG: ABC transporter ATP-binding protein [Lachnospiraceae bacterium]|nr:ABC transporter ATP-binding protein [uncultured Acetatifactor sp.]MCI9219503.1 ABC transporter ATP-binding protein [Lachnospiraceae bacterium]